MFNILVVDDNKNTRQLFKAVLENEKYKVFTAENGEDALLVMDKEHIDLVVLDVMMPRMDGFEFTKTLRDGNCNIPILMMTAKETMQDKRQGFIVGTDDYMVKPVNEEEMLLRISALLRRSQIVNEHKLTVGGTVLHYDKLTVCSDNGEIALPKKEFMLLYKLLAYEGKIFQRSQLMDEIWDMDAESDQRTVDVHINRLRDKFKTSKDFEIITVRGLGYKAVKK
jgi:DNA-binding response OmpR family regulator